jgi:Cof subfamily protein (haloacid dehalogenase superfamily)
MPLDKVLATDLDGTLFYPRKRVKMIPKDNREFIEKFTGDGGRLLLVSGRGKEFSEKVRENLSMPVDFIGYNGAIVFQKDQIIHETFFQKDNLKQILTDCSREYNLRLILLFTKDRNIVINRTDVSRTTNLFYFLYQFLQGCYKEKFIRSDRIYEEEIEKGEVYKAMLLFGVSPQAKIRAREANKVLRLRYPEAEFSWSDQCIEVTPMGCSKSSAIEFYLDYNHISRDNVLVVGDSGNDISMFEAFKKNSFCMEHGSDEVKKHATHVIKRFYDLASYIYPSEEK